MDREIGSEFHKMEFEDGLGIFFPRPGSLVFSGRTAIETVLKELPKARTALIPSYCCEAMVRPFITAGIEVKFYEVCWNGKFEINLDDSADILLWCNYFGFKNSMPDFDGVIIEDITHSVLSEIPCHSHSDYLVASLRKWEPILCGGYCSVKTDGTAPADDFVDYKKSAMELKTEYLDCFDVNKKHLFIQMFSECNSWLAKNYSGLSIDPWSEEYIKHVDTERQRMIRKQNAKTLYEGLERKTQFMFPLEDMDCPLFVPILVPQRDKVRSYLIKKDIYLPVHWPKPEGLMSNIYDMELSLVCDQRYGLEDMERIVSTLLEVL